MYSTTLQTLHDDKWTIQQGNCRYTLCLRKKRRWLSHYNFDAHPRSTDFVSYRTCSLGAEVSQDPLDRFSQSLHHMVGIELQMNATSSFFRYLKGRCHGNRFSSKNGAKLPTPALIALSIQNGMGYRDLNVCVNSTNDASISCKNFVNFGPVTPEKMGLICILFLRHGKKTSIFSQISQDILDRFLQFFHHTKAL